MDKNDEKLDKLMTDREFSTVGENSTPLWNNHRDNTDNPSNPVINFWRASSSMSPTLMDITTHNFS